MGGKKIFELMLEIGHKSQPLKAKLPNGYTHKWTVFVRGANNSKIEHCIQRVVFQLHDSFPNPHREITEPPYQVKETGYAGFEIPIEIYFKNKEKHNHVVFTLDLCLLLEDPHSSSMSEKVKFINPNREFERCLLKAGAKLLQPTKEKKGRSDSPPAKKQRSSSLIPSKDMSKQTPQASQPQSINQSHSSSSNHHHVSSQNNILGKSSHRNHERHQNHHGHNSGGSSSSNANSQSGANQTINNQFHATQYGPNNNNHQSNHSSLKQSSQQSSHKPKPSKEFIDVFGAPIVYNNNNNLTSKGHKTNTKDYDTRDTISTAKDSPSRPTSKSSQIISQTHTTSSQSFSQSSNSRSYHKHHQAKSYDPHNHISKASDHHPTKPVAYTPTSTKSIDLSQRIQPQQIQPAQSHSLTSLPDSLHVIQAKISSLSDNDRLQKIVDIIEESGEWFNLTPNKFEFDLKRLDKKTIHKIEKCLHI